MKTIKIRCSECKEKISVDGAFIGSMCRCPGCKAIILVPRLTSAEQGSFHRPSRPGDRKSIEEMARPIISNDVSKPKQVIPRTQIDKMGVPQVPGGPTPASVAEVVSKPAGNTGTGYVIETIHVDVSKLSIAERAAVPIARRVRKRGIASLVLLAVLLVAVGASAYLAVGLFSKTAQPAQNDEVEPDNDLSITPTVAADEESSRESTDASATPPAKEKLPNPFLVAKTPSIARCVPVSRGVVLFGMDTDTRMGDGYTYARDIVMASIRSLKSVDVATMLLEKQGVVGGKIKRKGGSKTVKKIKHRLTCKPDGPVKIRGRTKISEVVDFVLKWKWKASMLVLVTRDKQIVDPEDLGDRLNQAGITLVLIVLDCEDEIQKYSCEQLVDTAGGDSRLLLYDMKQLREYYDNRNNSD